jgi:Mor family transcriptional regulator
MTQELYTLELNFPMEFADRLEASHNDGINAATQAAIKLWVGLGDDIRETIIKQANKEGLSRAEFVGKAVSKLMNPEAPAYVNLNNGLTLAERREARNKEIVARGLQGMPRKELAAMFKVSEVRVHQLIALGKKELARQKILNDWRGEPDEIA